MVVPKFNEFMLPLLRLASDKQIHTMHETYQILSKEFKLTQEDRNEKLPSGRQFTFQNRVGWARTYLKKAKLLSAKE
ncbi:MAG: restriction endonuclease, partial [Candidatus Zixiibacteriota bacterium]